MNIKNKNILITGTGNGIGKYLAKELSGMGANIIAIDINKDALNSLTENSASIRHYVCDLRDSENIRKVHNIICKDYSNIDVLINNAGIMYSNPIIKMDNNGISEHSFEDWDNVIASNLSSAFYLTSLTVREMVKKRVKGLIINFSSVSAKGNIGQSAYSASKAGLEAFTKSLSKELAIFKIRSTAIAPGFIDTEGTMKALTEKQLKDWVNKVPLNRLGKKEEIFNAVKMIIENDFFNGKVLEVDGGLSI